MARKPALSFEEKTLTKGQIRKLNALRKSLGPEIADKAFAEWLQKYASSGAVQSKDTVALLIAENLEQLIEARKLTFPRGGYIVRRGRGRVIVKRAKRDNNAI